MEWKMNGMYEIWVPMDRWVPEHCRQMKVAWLSETQLGLRSPQSKQSLFAGCACMGSSTFSASGEAMLTELCTGRNYNI